MQHPAANAAIWRMVVGPRPERVAEGSVGFENGRKRRTFAEWSERLHAVAKNDRARRDPETRSLLWDNADVLNEEVYAWMYADAITEDTQAAFRGLTAPLHDKGKPAERGGSDSIAKLLDPAPLEAARSFTRDDLAPLFTHESERLRSAAVRLSGMVEGVATAESAPSVEPETPRRFTTSLTFTLMPRRPPRISRPRCR